MQLLGKTNLRIIVCYTISNGYVNKPVMHILFIINIIFYSNKDLTGGLYLISKGFNIYRPLPTFKEHFFTVPIMNLIHVSYFYGISKGTKHLLAFTDILGTFTVPT